MKKQRISCWKPSPLGEDYLNVREGFATLVDVHEKNR